MTTESKRDRTRRLARIGYEFAIRAPLEREIVRLGGLLNLANIEIKRLRGEAERVRSTEQRMRRASGPLP